MMYLLLIFGGVTNYLVETQPTSDHEFHLSKFLFEYVPEEEALQITMYIFIDDFEAALLEKKIDKMYICTEKENEKADHHIFEYLEEHIQLAADGQPLNVEFVGKEVAEDIIGMWCYLEVTNLKPFQSIEVQSSLLTEIFDDQKNIMNIIGPNKKRSYFILDKRKQTELLKF